MSNISVGQLEPNYLLVAARPEHIPNLPLYEQTTVVTGDSIDTSSQDLFLRGKGTQVINEQLVATISGHVERVNKLVSVRALRTRYQANAGDVVIGRVTSVQGKRWRIDLQSGQEAFLMLSAVTLPGSVQRRTTAEDELSMRQLYQEGDLITAEVQQLFHDGSVALQTRSAKYGRLRGGQLVTVPPTLVKRLKQHFTAVETEGVDVILGLNGMIWIAPQSATTQKNKDGTTVDLDPFDRSLDNTSCTPEERERVVRVSAAIRCLAAVGCLVQPGAIASVCSLSRADNVHIPAMQRPEFLAKVQQAEAERRAAVDS